MKRMHFAVTFCLEMLITDLVKCDYKVSIVHVCRLSVT